MCVLMCNFVSYFVCVILCIFVFLCDILLPSGVINDDSTVLMHGFDLHPEVTSLYHAPAVALRIQFIFRLELSTETRIRTSTTLGWLRGCLQW